MADTQNAVWWDPSVDQLGLKGVATPATLRDAGYEFLGRDTESLEDEGARIDLWKHERLPRWYLVLRKGRGRGGKIVSSAMCFTSQQLSTVIERFRIVAEVL